MAEPDNMIIPLLQEMRAENASLHRAAANRLDLIEQRLKAPENAQANFKNALSADSLLKLVTGEFEGRIEVLERGLKNLDTLGARIEKLEELR